MSGYKPFTKKVIQEAIRSGLNPNDLKCRLTGKSTALALSFISEAMASPGKEVEILDHYKDKDTSKRNRFEHMKSIVFNIIGKLGLEGFYVSNTTYCLVYELDLSDFEELE